MTTKHKNKPVWIRISVAAWLLSFIIFLLQTASLSFSAPSDTADAVSVKKAAIITCSGMIDDGLFHSIKRRSELAIQQGASYLIYKISTYGGLVESADKISKYFILDLADEVRTVAYIDTEAISAGAMISVSCKDIIMRKNTTIGDCAPIVMGGKLEGTEREKMESFIRSIFKRAAQANNYPQALLKAMVSKQIEVYQIKNLKTGKFEYFEAKDLPTDSQTYDLENKKLIVESDKLLTLTSAEALNYGIARAVVDNIEQAIAFLEQRDNVKIARPVPRFHTNWSEELVRILNSPAVLGILITIAMLGVYIELNTPGLGLPGLVAVIAFAVIIGSKYLVGLANWVEIAVFILGVILLMIEVLIIPGFGFTGAVGALCIILGLVGMLIRNAPDQIPWPRTDLDWSIFIQGMTGLTAGILGFFAAVWLLGKYIPKISFLSGLVLAPSIKAGQTELNIPANVQVLPSEFKIGQKGTAESLLRPTGKVRFGDSIVDALSRAEYIPKGTTVEIVKIEGNKITVKPSDNIQQ